MNQKSGASAGVVVIIILIKVTLGAARYSAISERRSHARHTTQVASRSDVRKQAREASESSDRQLEYAQAYLTQGDPAKALRYATKAITLDENNTQAYVVRCLAKLQTGEREQAQSDLTMALQLDPADTEALAVRSEFFSRP